MHFATTLAEATAQAKQYVADVAITLPIIQEMAEKIVAEAEAQGFYVAEFCFPDGLHSLSFKLGGSNCDRTASVDVDGQGFSVTRNDNSVAAHEQAKNLLPYERHLVSLPLSIVSTTESFFYRRYPVTPSEREDDPGCGSKLAPRGAGGWVRFGGEALKTIVGNEDHVIENVLRDVRAFLDGERGL